MSNKCCDKMDNYVDYASNFHENVFRCPDALIWYSRKFEEYGLIIHDGGESFIEISYCPWCGTKLPKSKRDLWFKTLEKLGFDDPLQQDIPEEFKTDEWYKNRDL